MSIFDADIFYYPLIKHPLSLEKCETQENYISLIEHFCKTFDKKEILTSLRFKRYKNDYFSESSNPKSDLKKTARQVLGTHFVPFKFFTYRFVFIFDCIYLMAYDDFEKAKAICTEAKKYTNHRYHKRLDDFVNDLFGGRQIFGRYLYITEDMQASWNVLQTYRLTSEKKIILTATMSAGKSTLVNAIFGKDFALTKKAACTSTVVEYIPMPIFHQNYLIFRTDKERIDCPANDVRNYLETQNSPASVVGYSASVLSKLKLCIYDSPGINSSRHPEHKAVTREALSKTEYDCVVYVIPVENYGANDDYTHLKYILQHTSYRNIIFVLNMMDTCDIEDDNLEEIICDVKKHLSDIGYSEPVVCPISAKAGLIFKQALFGQCLSPNAEATLASLQSLFYGKSFDLSRFYLEYPISDLKLIGNVNSFEKSDETGKDRLLTSFFHSGLPQFEQLLFEIIKEA